MSDTVCTTIRVCNGVPEFWRLHRERLLYFSIVLNRMVNLEQIEQEVVRYATKLVQGVLRVEIDCYGSVQINSRSIPEKSGLRWRTVLSHRTQGEASIKWLNREDWILERKRHNVDVLVLLNAEQQYLECCIGNIFVYRSREQQWYTPEVTNPILPGIMRSALLSHANIMGESVIESTLVFEDTDELWMSNALRGLCPLTVHDSPPPRWSLCTAETHLESKALVHFQQVLSKL